MANHGIAYQERTLAAADRKGTEWELGELERMANLRLEGKSIAEVAEALERTYYATATALRNAGMVKPRAPRIPAPVRVCGSCYLDHAGECW